MIIAATSGAIVAVATIALLTPDAGGDTTSAARTSTPPDTTHRPIATTDSTPTSAHSAATRTAAASTSSTVASSSSTSTVASSSSIAPEPIDVSDRPVVVFGNSTDVSAGHGEQYRRFAWPSQLQTIVERDPRVEGVTIVNEAQPGSTIAAPNPWGDQPHLRLVTHAPTILARYSPAERAGMIVVIAPSVIDLQFNTADADSSVADLLTVLDVVDSYGVGRIVVLPMNPVSAGVDEVLHLNDAVASFNAQIHELGISAYPNSPLVEAGTNDGLDDFYDEYPGTGFDGESTGADGLHIEASGQQVIAETVAPIVLAAMLADGTPPTGPTTDDLLDHRTAT